MKNTQEEKTLEQEFKDTQQEYIESGCIKFEQDFVSTFEIYKAAKKFAKEDKNVLAASVRKGGQNQIALDFKYDTKNIHDKKRRGNLLEEVFKPFFKEAFGEDYITGWDYSNKTTIIK